MDLFSHPCPCCASINVRPHTRYTTQNYDLRTLYHCREGEIYFSETFAIPIAGLTTPLSRIITILKARSEGMRLNAIARTVSVSKKSVIDWERRLAGLTPTLLLYSLLHESTISHSIGGLTLFRLGEGLEFPIRRNQRPRLLPPLKINRFVQIC